VSTAPETADGRPLRIVFSLLHAGYLRHYAEPIRLLAERGHSIHIALFRHGEADESSVLLKMLRERYATVTAGVAPRRRHLDGWRGLAWLVRGLVDVLRYADPRYEHAQALRSRAAEKVQTRVTNSHNDPITRWLIARAVGFVANDPDPRRARWCMGALRAVERAIPSSSRIDRLLREFGADAVVASPVVDIGSPQVEFVKSAQRHHLPSAIAVASWDNLTSKGLLRVVPDRVFVWNEIQRTELEEMHAIPADRVVVTGGQKFDPWFDREPSGGREEFLRKVGLDPRREYVLYLCSSAFIAPDELSFVRRWLDAVRASGDPRVRELGVLVRPHPQNPAQWIDPDLSGYDDVVVWPRGGQFPDAGEAQTAFFDSMAHSVAVVGINTSAQIDSAIVGKPVYTIRAFDASQEGTIHFHYLLHDHGGFVRDAATLEEHVAQLAEGLADPERVAAELKRFVGSFVRPRGLDRPVAPIVADEIEALARLQPVRPRLGALILLRLALYPLVGSMTAAAALLTFRYRRGQRRATRLAAAGEQ
jgi:hypothetical protein